jgi:hypothetical protein
MRRIDKADILKAKKETIRIASQHSLSGQSCTTGEASEDAARRRAYFIWLDEGCPDGREKQHWTRACQEIRGHTERSSEKSGTFAA